MSIDTKHQEVTSKTNLAPRLLAETSYKSVIQAPLDKVDIPEWLFNLSDKEYQRCSVAHIGCGSSRAADGKRMSLNIEEIGGAIAVQHYIEDLAEKQHSRAVSITDTFAQGARTTAKVIWELTATAINNHQCELTNTVLVYTTDDYESFLDKNNIPFEQAKAALQSALEAHNAEETPLFAKSIETKALSGERK
jgi:hypothetical protein